MYVSSLSSSCCSVVINIEPLKKRSGQLVIDFIKLNYNGIKLTEHRKSEHALKI